MHENSAGPSAAGVAVRAALSAAARRRRARQVSAIVWRVAPIIAAAAMALAVVRRWTLWSPWLPLAVLVAGAAVLSAYVFAAVRRHAISDALAATIDEDAGLHGELRSASWFAARPRRDSWSDFHLERAAARLEGLSWAALYPSVHAPRARAVTALFALAALALTVVLPERVTMQRTASAASAASAKAAAKAGPVVTELLPPELLAELQALLAAVDMGNISEAERLASSAELREFLNRLAADPDLLKKLAAALAAQDPRKAPTAKELKALAERARKAADMASMSQDMREALEKMADEAEQAQSEQMAESEDGEPAGSDAAQKGETAQSNAPGSMQELSVQMSRQANPGGGAGIMMMSNPDDSSSGPPGSGVGGSGSQEAAAAAAMALAAAFSHETVEASQDNAGDNVETEVRRMTEQGTSAVGFTHGAAGRFDKSRAAAAPPVPEARRSGVQTYFVREKGEGKREN